jgi:DNA polymerase elongation subunit (family B)
LKAPLYINITDNGYIYKKHTKNMSATTQRKKRIDKSFRLLDFHIVQTSPDDVASDEPTSSSSDSDSEDVIESTPRKDTKQFCIQMFGINETGETASILATGFKPFFFIKVPEQGWNGSVHNAFINHLRGILGEYYEDSILRCELVERQKLYGFTAGKTFPFIQITFRNTQVLNKVKNLWFKKNVDGSRKLIQYKFDCNGHRHLLDLYESFIPPLLRYFHIHEISPSGWVRVPKDSLIQSTDKTTTCTYEYVCDVKKILPQNDKETPVPYKICSFDIEASSSHGDFPLPVKTYKRLAIQIVDAIDRQKTSMGGVIDNTQIQAIIRNSVVAGFGHKNVSGIDCVYPKYKVTKQQAGKYVDELLGKTLGQIELTSSAKGNNAARANSIQMAFERTAAEMSGGGGGNDENDEDDDDDDDEDDGVMDTSADMEDECDEYGVNPWENEDCKSHRDYTCIDVLLDKIETVNTRELKVKEVTQALDQICPPLEGDQVSFIGSTFIKYGQTEPYLNHCLVVGSCDPVQGAAIECASTERDMLLMWRDLIERENPDIIIGYNIFGFDSEFIFRRSEELGCALEFSKLSRIHGHNCLKKHFGRDGADDTYSLETTSVKLASGEYNLRYYSMVGRQQLDLYAYFRRDYNFSSYKLDDVASQLIGDDIKKVEYVEEDGSPKTILYTKNMMGLHEGDYIHLEKNTFTTNPYKGGAKFHVQKILYDKDTGSPIALVIPGTELSEESRNPAFAEKKYKLRWSVAKDDVTPQDIFRLTRGSSADRAIVAKYCIQDCNLVHHLMRKVDVITGFVEMSKICSVPVNFLIFRGQGIKLTSFVAKKCREKNTLMPDLQKTPSAGYEGAIVLIPKCGMYIEDSVACVDYASLYPSGMISQNLSHDTKVWTKEYDLDGRLIRTVGELKPGSHTEYLYDNLPGYQYIDIEFDTYQWLRNPEKPQQKAKKMKVGKQICRWAQGVKGIMPSILEELLQARATTRKIAKAEKDPFMQNVLDKRQLGYKVTANSLYGQCGATTSTFHERDVAASTTATGRMMITYAKRIIEEVYGNLEYETKNHGKVLCSAEYVYGDTDSVFFTFRLKDPVTKERITGNKELELTIEIAQDVAKLCTQWLKPPMELTYEKTLKPFFLLSKKRYVGTLYEDEPTNGKMKFMGLSLKRRDTCDFVKDIYGGILNILMDDDHDVGKALQFLEREMERLICGDTSWDKLLLTKALRSDYKKPEQIAHRVLAERIGQRDPGNKPKPGDRIAYLYIVPAKPKLGGVKKALQGDKIEIPEYIKQHNLPIDYTHYITNQLMKPIMQLLGLAIEEIYKYKGKQREYSRVEKELQQISIQCPDPEEQTKKREKYCSNMVRHLIFEPVLLKIQQKKMGLRDIGSFFGKPKS